MFRRCRDKRPPLSVRKKLQTDLAVIDKWNRDDPNYNSCLVAQAKIGGVWILDCDSVEVKQQIEKDTGKKLPDTFAVQSASAGHRYFRQNEESLKRLRNFSVHRGDKEFFSVRFDNMYCVGPLSVHPSGTIYKIVRDVEPVEAPSWFLDWLLAQAEETKLPVTASLDGPVIPRGSHDNELTRIAGKLRGAGMEENSIADALIEVCEKRCENYGSDYKEMCSKIAHSICKHPAGDSSIPMIYHGPTVPQNTQQTAVAIAEEQEPEIDDTGLTSRPVFPSWVMDGTSLYEYLVKPVVETSSKYPELVFMPGVLMFLNAIALRVRLRAHNSVPNLFLGLISPYGKFFKSSSCEAAIDYFKKMNLAASYSLRVPNMATTALILSPGSPEGAALQMKRAHGSKAVFYYDELGSFCAKASVEHSALLDKMLAWYESKEDGNDVKAKESCYHFEAGKYCFSWLWCTTDRKLPTLWSKLTGSDSGLNNRMFFLLSPEQPKESDLYSEPEFDTTETHNRIMNAWTHNPNAEGLGTYDYEIDVLELSVSERIKGLDPRSQAMFEHLALYFAIDLGRDAIDAECCSRARALVDYRNAVEAYLDLFQADSKDAALPHEIIRELRRNYGKMKYRDLYHNLHALDRLKSWNHAIGLLRDNGLIAIREPRTGKGNEQIPRMVYLLKQAD